MSDKEIKRGLSSIILKIINGNQIADLGTFTKTDGSTGGVGAVTGNMADINLAEDTFHRTFPNVLDTTAVATLPDMQACTGMLLSSGSGKVRDLREAATQSATLQNLLTQYQEQIVYSYSAWLLSQSCNAASIRVCQPVPVARKLSTTVGDSLIVMRSLVAVSCAPLARLSSLVCRVFGKPDNGMACLKSSATHSGLSSSINSTLSLRFINTHLSFIRLSKTYHTDTTISFHKNQGIQTLIQIPKSANASFAIVASRIHAISRRVKVKISRPLKRQTTQLDIEYIFSGVEADFHKSYCMYKMMQSQELLQQTAANDNEWRVVA